MERKGYPYGLAVVDSADGRQRSKPLYWHQRLHVVLRCRASCIRRRVREEKVLCGSGTEMAAPTVVRKLGKWLVAKGYDPDVVDVVD
jgi:hypothetical protein